MTETMRRSCRRAALATVLVAALVAPASANEFSRGLEAYLAGDIEVAVSRWLPAAEAGDSASQYAIGVLAETGAGVAQDYASAARWYASSAERGYAPAARNLSRLYLEGRGVPRDAAKGGSLLVQALDNRVSCNPCELDPLTIGLIYLNGWGVPPDRSSATAQFREAAEAGSAQAQLELAYLLEFAPAPDYREAMFWYAVAAELEGAQRVPAATRGQKRLGDRLGPAVASEVEAEARAWLADRLPTRMARAAPNTVAEPAGSAEERTPEPVPQAAPPVPAPATEEALTGSVPDPPAAVTRPAPEVTGPKPSVMVVAPLAPPLPMEPVAGPEPDATAPGTPPPPARTAAREPETDAGGSLPTLAEMLRERLGRKNQPRVEEIEPAAGGTTGPNLAEQIRSQRPSEVRTPAPARASEPIEPSPDEAPALETPKVAVRDEAAPGSIDVAALPPDSATVPDDTPETGLPAVSADDGIARPVELRVLRAPEPAPVAEPLDPVRFDTDDPAVIAGLESLVQPPAPAPPDIAIADDAPEPGPVLYEAAVPDERLVSLSPAAPAPDLETRGDRPRQLLQPRSQTIPRAPIESSTLSPAPVRRFAIQVGAFSKPLSARIAAVNVVGRHPQLLGEGIIEIRALERDGRTLYRSRIAGLTRDQALAACGRLREVGEGCQVVTLSDSPVAAAFVEQ